MSKERLERHGKLPVSIDVTDEVAVILVFDLIYLVFVCLKSDKYFETTQTVTPDNYLLRRLFTL